jgi:exopolyphosphatase / guanosine-5'-triphosphate,3'-diphosphate pyrophosphatase
VRVAAVDVGTNSVRLLVAEGGETLRQIERHMQITRLGAGVDERGRLDDAALERTLDCIASYARRWRDLGAEAARVAATSAVRDAADRDRFFDGVRERARVEAVVLSAEQEARSTYRGAIAQTSGEPPYLVLDIGGGSTEFIVGDGEPEAMTSRQLGCVRLHERCLPTDPPTSAELDDAAAVVDEHLDAVASTVDVPSARTLVGVAGTVTTLGALHLGLPEYQPERIHGTRVSLDAVRAITAKLAGMTAGERAELGPMAPGREDVIVAGAVILQRVMERFGFPEVIASEADILDGLALELLVDARQRLGRSDQPRR